MPRNSTRLRFRTMYSSQTLEMPYRVAPPSTRRSPMSLFSPIETAGLKKTLLFAQTNQKLCFINPHTLIDDFNNTEIGVTASENKFTHVVSCSYRTDTSNETQKGKNASLKTTLYDRDHSHFQVKIIKLSQNYQAPQKPQQGSPSIKTSENGGFDPLPVLRSETRSRFQLPFLVFTYK